MTRIVVTHHNADLDALACLVAAAKLYGATPVIPSFVNPAVRRADLHKDHLGVISVAEVDAPTFVAVVDVRDARRLKDTARFIDAAERVVVWDHHPASEFDVRADEVHIEPVGACIPLLMEALLEAQVTISSEDVQPATLFMLGIYSDTGRLSLRLDQPRDAKIAAWLLAPGANLRVLRATCSVVFSRPARCS
ncbi:MAG: DHH family phosphoesterase [bacterium]